MRLFIGIPLPDDIRRSLKTAAEALQKSARGNFSHPENLHITLQFLGEKSPEELEPIRRAMARAAEGKHAFPLSLSAPGRFERGSESIVWYGVDGETAALQQLYRDMGAALQAEGVSFDRGAYTPHITLARRVRAERPWPEVFAGMAAQGVFRVEGMVLFESTRVDGRLTYVPLLTQRF